MLPLRPRVLLVDDDADTCEMYSWNLEVRGFNVLTVNSGVSALAEAGTDTPDVIVSDYTLPGLDGLSLVEKLKESPYTAHVPFVLLTGHALDSREADYARELCARVLLKPVLPDNLADVITTVLVETTATRVAGQVKTIQQRLRQSASHDRESLMSLIDTELQATSNPPAALLADDEGHYVSVNQRATELTGRTREQLLSSSVWDLTPRVSAAHGRRMWRDFVAAGSMQGTYVLSGPDGEHLTVWFCAVANILPGLHLSLLAALPPGASYPAAA